MVHRDETLSDVDRMHYLLSCMRGDASDALDGLNLTEANFRVGWEMLVSRFEHKNRLVSMHIDTLSNLPAVTSQNARELRRLRDAANNAITSLRNLGRLGQGSEDFLVYFVLRKLPQATREAWTLSLGENRDCPAYQTLDQFLGIRINALEDPLPSPSRHDSNATVSNQKTGKVKTTTTHVVNVAKPGSPCPACRSNHLLFKCAQFQSQTPSQRYDLVRRGNRCVNCFSAKHLANQCVSKYTCKKCGKKHHTLLHLSDESVSLRRERTPSPPSDSAIRVREERVDSHMIGDPMAPESKILLATATIRVYTAHGRSETARALLDQGSATSVISERLVQRLRLPKLTRSICIRGVGDTQTHVRHAVSISIAPHNSDVPMFSTTALVLKSVTKYLPTSTVPIRRWRHISGLFLADRDPLSSDPIDVLIGADLYGLLVRGGVRRGARNEPVAQNTALGWILSGSLTHPTPTSSLSSTSLHVHHGSVSETFERELRRFWEIEEVPQVTHPSPEETICEEHFLNTHFRTPEGRYVVRLPFKGSAPVDLGQSRNAALAHFKRSELRLHRDLSHASDYIGFLSEYEKLGHMTRIASAHIASGPVYYIPHHGVLRADSATSRLRVVFNASSRTSTGTSLNDHLLIGPKLQADLPAIVLRWRRHRLVCTADIEKMYRQILVDTRDRNFQRIFWRASTSEPIHEYRLNTVTYGTASAPFQAQRVLKQLASDEGHAYPLAVSVVHNQTYVDDCIFGADDSGTLIRIRDQMMALLQKGCFRLRKWASNCPALLSDLDPSDHGLAREKDMQSNEPLRVLGIAWNPERDVFRFRVVSTPPPSHTKRGILSFIARLFDPLGWAAPTIIVAKILIQELWLLKCDWDAPLPSTLENRWRQYHSTLPSLERIEIPRWMSLAASTANTELHGFSDASTAAYAAVVYLRVATENGTPTTSLLMAKSKVAPLKTLSIPRLELMAALLLARLVVVVRSALQLGDIPCRCWTDSSVTRAWLTQPPSRWTSFVANRVSEVQTILPDSGWYQVPTRENPADCASRGIHAPQLVDSSLWWRGPPWLRLSRDQWPVQEAVMPSTTREERRRVHVGSVLPSELWDLSLRYSSWPKLLRVTAYLFRFLTFSRSMSRRRDQVRPQNRSRGCAIPSLTPGELERAERYWLGSLQLHLFPKEMAALASNHPVDKTSSLASLNPYLDADGLLRVGGRLRHSTLSADQKHPIILSSHPLVSLLISHHHLLTLHGGPSLTLASLRERVWLLRARPTVRAVLYRCVSCTRAKAEIPAELMGDLPASRVLAASRAFVHTGVDYAGPLLVRTAPGRGHKSQKCYIALFVCMTTKAVHLELVLDYSTAAFLAAYQRFASRRGRPRAMYSDNGTTFQGADRELCEAHRSATRDPNLLNRLASDKVEWHFLPPAAPHFGGLWEAGVRSMKHHLKRCVGAHTLTTEELTTLLCRIEACLNSRPICAVSECFDDYSALTPGHFLIGASLIASPEPSVLEINETRLSRWQVVQRITEQFWRTWTQDYLHTLQQRPKWRTVQRLARVGKIVLLRNPLAPPTHWELGRIIECHPGDDGLTRVVSVKTSRSQFKRPITKVCFLPVDINEASEKGSGTAGGDPTLVT